MHRSPSTRPTAPAPAWSELRAIGARRLAARPPIREWLPEDTPTVPPPPPVPTECAATILPPPPQMTRPVSCASSPSSHNELACASGLVLRPAPDAAGPGQPFEVVP